MTCEHKFGLKKRWGRNYYCPVCRQEMELEDADIEQRGLKLTRYDGQRRDNSKSRVGIIRKAG